MPVEVMVVDESGNSVGPSISIPGGSFPSPGDHRFECLRVIDPYGDTIFNHLQISVLLKDLELARMTPELEVLRGHIAGIQTLCRICLSEPHLYLKFVGD